MTPRPKHDKRPCRSSSREPARHRGANMPCTGSEMSLDAEDETIRCVVELANTPFDLASFRQVWERFGARWNSSGGDEFGFNLVVGHGYPLWVDPLGSRIISARLPTCYLDDWHDGAQTASGDRAVFDSVWVRLANRVRSLVGAPALHWCDKDTVGYRATVWKAAHGLLFVQQAAIDSEFGDEVCLTAESMRIEEFTPFDTLARLQRERSRRLHDEHGFPPLSA